MRWDVYARVVDNYGDVGFAWRLARGLAARGEAVRLVVDDPSALAWMAPDRGLEPRVETWPGTAEGSVDVAVETFGCGFPPEASARLWIDVEHLTAERYAARSHGLPSPGRERTVWFWFPGFDPDTGGVIGGFRGAAPSVGAARTVSVFCYADARLADLVDALADRPTRFLLLPGPATDIARHGAARAELLPWQSQDGYDRLLAACDLNLVRGEDSLVRAIHAGRPFLWQAYPQADGAHHAKVRALVERLCRGAPASLHDDLQRLHAWWNGFADAPSRWPPADAWTRAVERLRDDVGEPPDLVERLVAFAGVRLSAL